MQSKDAGGPFGRGMAEESGDDSGEAGIFMLPERLDLAAIADIRAGLLDFFAKGGAAVSGAAVTRVCASGAALLLAAAREADALGREFTLSDPAPALLETFARLGLSSHLLTWEPL